MFMAFSTISEVDVINPRGGRIRLKEQLNARDMWKGLKDTVDRISERDSSIQESLQRARTWLLPETEHERSDIEKEIKF